MSGRRAPSEGALEAAVRAANDELYAAVESGDLDRLATLWWASPAVVCIHPGAAPIHGVSAVLRSWALIMASTSYVQFVLTDVVVSLAGEVAAVTCTENMLTSPELPAGAAAAVGGAELRGGRAAALNVFRLTPEGWRLWIHQAAPVGSPGHD